MIQNNRVSWPSWPYNWLLKVCSPIFDKEFLPCFIKYGGHEYYKVRMTLLEEQNTKDVIKIWFKLQKYQLYKMLHQGKKLKK